MIRTPFSAVLALILVFKCQLIAQISNQYFRSNTGLNLNYWTLYEENTKANVYKEQKIKKKVAVSKKNKKELATIFTYNTEGHIASYQPTKDVLYKITYVDADHRKTVEVYKKGELVRKDSFCWDKSRMVARFVFDKNRKLKEQEKYEYDSNYVTSYVFEKLQNGKPKEKVKRIYEYYPDYSYKKITYYKNAKPIYFSVFDCNPIGENHKIKKDSAYNCVKYDVDSLGNKIKVSIVNQNKSSYKRVEYFNGKEQRVAEKMFSLEKNQLLLYMAYRPGNNLALTNYVNYHKGKENYRCNSDYDSADKLLKSTYFVKGKFNGSNDYTYNEKGFLDKHEQYNKKHKKVADVKYEYEYY